MNRDAVELERLSLHKPLLNAKIVVAAFCVFAAHPLRCLRAFARFFQSRNPAVFTNNLAVFPKALWLAQLARRWGATHIHAQWALTTATMAMTAGEISGIPWSCTAHRGDIAGNNLLAIKADRAAFFRFIAQSGLKMARDLGVRVASPRIHVIHMGVIIPPSVPVRMPDNNPPRLLCAANLLPVKGHRYLLEAVRLLKQRGVACELDIAGDGPLWRELQELAQTLDILERVRFLGVVPHDRLLEGYRQSEIDAVVLPSVDLGGGLHEGIPVALIEAMAHGIPVVSTTTGGIPELLRDGAGVMVPPADPEALADAMAQLLGDAELRRRLATAGRRRVADEWDVKKVVRQLLQQIETAAATESPTSTETALTSGRDAIDAPRRPFVLLDRDGTIIVERNYLSDPDQVELLPGVGDGLRKLSDLGVGLAVVTNQSAVGRGIFSREQVDRVNRRMEELLAGEGVRLAGIYVCPHAPEDNCHCRKPAPGLVEEASRELGFDPRESFVIGDKQCDVELGRRSGAATFLVRTGYGAELALAGTCSADYVVDDLVEAAGVVERLLARDKVKQS